MISNIEPTPPTSEDYCAFQRAWSEVSRPLIRHMVTLESCGSPRYLRNADGSFERLGPIYPDGVAELIADAERMRQELFAATARSFGFSPEKAPAVKD